MRADRARACCVGAGAEVDRRREGRARARCVSPGCRVAAGADGARSSVLLDGCAVGEGARVSGSILAPGVTVEAGAVLADAVVGRDERVPLAGTMIDDVLGIPDQLRDALWRIESARLEPGDAAGVFVCGMGGSAIGGDLAAAALGDRLTRPLVAVRGYELPSWATPEWTVLCSSYSGQTEETLACFEAAEALGARRIVASTGGALVDRAREAGVPVVGLPGIFQPRAAVAYMFVVAAEVAALAGIAPRVHTEIDAAAAFLEREAEALQPRRRRDRRASSTVPCRSSTAPT